MGIQVIIHRETQGRAKEEIQVTVRAILIGEVFISDYDEEVSFIRTGSG